MQSSFDSTEYPKISLITPSYNQAAFLEATINSILSQGYPNLEYIIMDGGSSDGSVDIIKKYSKFLTYWESGKDQGQADAIYRGFEKSSGEILGWLNSDDLLLPNSLHHVGRFFKEHPQEECVIGGCLFIDAHGNLIRNRLGIPICNRGAKVTFHRLLLFNTSGFNQPATFWRRAPFYEVGGFDRSLHFCFDYDLYLRLSKRRPISHLKKTLAAFRLHSTSKTCTINHVMIKESELLWERYQRNNYPYWYRRIASSFYGRKHKLSNNITMLYLLLGKIKTNF